MPAWDSVVWLPICAGVSAAGLVISFFVWRKRGARSGLRGAAWSLLPIALYLSGAILLVYRVIAAFVNFAGSFVWAPKTWAGLLLFGLAAVFFLGTGGLPLMNRRRKARQRRRDREQAAGADGKGADRKSADGKAAIAPAAKTKQTVPAADNDLSEIEDILRKHNIK